MSYILKPFYIAGAIVLSMLVSLCFVNEYFGKEIVSALLIGMAIGMAFGYIMVYQYWKTQKKESSSSLNNKSRREQ